MNTLAVFRSRNDAISVYGYLKKRGVACAVVNTPSRLKKGCGLSFVFHESVAYAVDQAIRTVKAESFVGYFPR